jgi:DNA-binding MltR family transcriptional regulator
MTADPTEEWKKLLPLPDFIKVFQTTTERGAALSAGANLDAIMGKCLMRFMIREKKILNDIFGEYGPMGSFGRKVQFVYALGIISESAYDELLIINKIRNKFAHEKEANDFDAPAISNKAKNLMLLQKPPLFMQYLLFGQGRTIKYPAEELWKGIKSGLLEKRLDLSKQNWAFMLEVSTFSACFEKSLTTIQDKTLTGQPLF